MIKEIKISGLDIIIEKKQIKNMYIKISPPDGMVKVTAPVKMPDNDIEKFIQQKISWICQKKKQFAECQGNIEKNYESGEKHYLWGSEYELSMFFSEGTGEVWSNDKKIFMRVRKGASKEYKKKLLEHWYRDVLALKIKSVLPECVEIVGKAPIEWHIKDMKTRWGTCNVAKKRVWLNLQLVKQPEECLRYVIIHELTHLYEKSHNEVFKAYMDEFCPDWRNIKKKMRIDI